MVRIFFRDISADVRKWPNTYLKHRWNTTDPTNRWDHASNSRVFKSEKDYSHFCKQIILTIWTEVIFAENSKADDVFWEVVWEELHGCVPPWADCGRSHWSRLALRGQCGFQIWVQFATTCKSNQAKFVNILWEISPIKVPKRFMPWPEFSLPTMISRT